MGTNYGVTQAKRMTLVNFKQVSDKKGRDDVMLEQRQKA